MMKNIFRLWIFIFLMAIPLVHASVGARLHNIFITIIEIGSLNFLGVPSGSMLVMFVRFLIGILIFTIVFALLSFAQRANLRFIQRNHAIVIALCIALITMIFLPVQVLLAAGGGLGVAIGLALVALPVVAIVMMIIKTPDGVGAEGRTAFFIKLVLCLILFWVLTAMNYHIGQI